MMMPRRFRRESRRAAFIYLRAAAIFEQHAAAITPRADII